MAAISKLVARLAIRSEAEGWGREAQVEGEDGAIFQSEEGGWGASEGRKPNGFG